MKISELADQVRGIPLRNVLEHYGFEVKREGTTLRARGAHHNIVVTGNNYGNHSVSYGLRNNVWTGMYIYDFTSSKFEDVIWSWSQNL